MEVDEALGMLGSVGKWQIIYYTVLSVTCCVPPCVHMLAIIYIGKCVTHLSMVVFSVFPTPRSWP